MKSSWWNPSKYNFIN